MAFDQGTRNRLQRFVNEARNLLTEEFTRQLQRDFGMDPKTGEVAGIAKLSDLDDSRLETARVLRQVFAHYLAIESSGGPTTEAQVLERIVREQAFTVLNRLAALRMAEARGLLVESVGNGYQAKGFQLYARLAGTGLGETGDAYRVYLFSVFDELAQDLPGLFGRYAPQGRLFPREAALLPLLALINDAEIEPLWGEDETIGWIYQYFNSKEERKAMRDASQAPRNSRELAVRNQFFTPRYVVEFLVDNTLGRMWFNATGGRSALRERCQYLLVKPDETPPAPIKLRDPRTLKLLDPACGSMHFGLYAFDLFLPIYREAWDWEQEHGPGSLDLSTQAQAGFKPLRQTYADEAALLRDVPRLIIEHNIYGVDIDPRAAQIASLALWLRAQRAWHEAGVKATDRSLIGSGHVVGAIGPPAESELREQIASKLEPLDAELFEKTLDLLKGIPELGVLLRVERKLPQLIRQVYVGTGTGLFADQEQESWVQAEMRLRDALNDFGQASRTTYQGRLFAQDVLQGLRMTDLSREKFDIVVMNPPFGLSSRDIFAQLKEDYPDGYVDLYACFIIRAIELCRGWVGAISSRSFLIVKKLERLRANWVVPRIEYLLDLGWPVMDDATVQSAAFTLNCTRSGPGEKIIAIDRKQYSEKAEQLISPTPEIIDIPGSFAIDRSTIDRIPRARLLYNLPENALHLFFHPVRIGGEIIIAKKGMTSFSDVRFLRARHEVNPDSIGKGLTWVPLAKGGAYAVFYSDLPLLVNWADNGGQICEVNRLVNGQVAQARQASVHWYKCGGTYSRRCKNFGVRVLPADFIIGEKGPAILPIGSGSPLAAVGLMNARLFRVLINLQANAKQYDTGIVESCPYFPLGPTEVKLLEELANNAIDILRRKSQRTEGDALFVCPEIRSTFSEMEQLVELRAREVRDVVSSSMKKIDEIVDSTYQVDSAIMERIISSENATDDDDALSSPTHDDDLDEDGDNEAEDTRSRHLASSLFSYVFGCAIGRWDIRYATGEKDVPFLANPFDPLPNVYPGALLCDRGKFSEANASLSLICPPGGILVDEDGHRFDVVDRLRSLILLIWKSQSEEIEQAIATVLGADSLRSYLRRPIGFFSDHLATYTRSKRKAPIYWPLSTASNSYTLWLYYPRLNDQSLYAAINEFIEPTLKHLGSDLATLRSKGMARSLDDEKRFESLQTSELELIELRDTLLKLAPNYKPNHDDGVQITAAPLWPLFRHKPWQKVLKETWEKLSKGDYDWAHLAMSYWPERVRKKCTTDKSLAIAHGLEDLYVEPEAKPKNTRGRKKTDSGALR